jgi:hypothetical protein
MDDVVGVAAVLLFLFATIQLVFNGMQEMCQGS